MVLLQNYFNKRVPLFFYFFVTYVLLHNNLNKQLKEELSTEKKSPDELIKLLTEYINMSEAAEHPASQKALHGVWNEEKGYTLPKVTISAQEYKAIDQKSFNRVAQNITCRPNGAIRKTYRKPLNR